MTSESLSQPAISVCILTANRDNLLEPLVAELISQLSPADEIVILDTAASDSTRELILGFNSKRVHYHPFEMPEFNFAAARNKLLDLATKDIVAFIDDDAFPFPDWLEQIRTNLAQYQASGGATVADGPMPEWWASEINWCIGLSPPGTILGQPGFYPETCNLAATDDCWSANPFDVVTRENRTLYATGREDAEWWQDRRILGDNVTINFRQAVMHHVHADRLNLAYVKQRARNDGVSSWLRRPGFEAATAIPWDLAHIAGVVLDNRFRHPFNRQRRLADAIWLQRQWGKFCAIWQDETGPRSRRRQQLYQLGKAAAFQVKIRAGIAAFKSVNMIRHRGDYPSPAPRRIFISADCFLGDTILLRRHVKAVADTFRHASILVSCKFPELMSGLAENVDAQTTDMASGILKSSGAHVDAAIVPYFQFGDTRLWREKLSSVGATFNCDVGFPGRRDYQYARRAVEKNMELHEHENLARLFRLWPLRPAGLPDPPVIPREDYEWAEQMVSTVTGGGKYILVQFGAGYESKEWPLDCWIPFLRAFGEHIDLPLVITGGLNWKEAGEIAVKEVRHPAGMVTMFGSTVSQMMALVRGASYFIGACSGPKHVAMAFSVPTFTLYAASEPHRWGAAEDHHLHGYANALPQKLSEMELQHLDVHHRIRLLKPALVAEKAVAHYQSVMRLEQGSYHALPSE